MKNTAVATHFTDFLLLGLKNNLLHLHLIKQVVALDGLTQWHDFVRHEPSFISLLSVMAVHTDTHPSLS